MPSDVYERTLTGRHESRADRFIGLCHLGASNTTSQMVVGVFLRMIDELLSLYEGSGRARSSQNDASELFRVFFCLVRKY